MDYLKLATIDELTKRKVKSLSILGRKIGIFKRDNDRFFAVETGCKHQGADLTTGKIENNVATCPRHGWKYDLLTGRCLNHASPRLRKFDVKIIGKEIHVSLQPVNETEE
ncbi:MAG: non-heme iron oxygenase ferredoxin subunit [Deltaproteobacteria bacterium]|nr:MAG: non-heme iron oxygenase ferredoxin subunit [Deltaproteobacteria bacterium]